MMKLTLTMNLVIFKDFDLEKRGQVTFEILNKIICDGNFCQALSNQPGIRLIRQQTNEFIYKRFNVNMVSYTEI